MPSLIPTAATICQAFAQTSPFQAPQSAQRSSKYAAQEHLYNAWSVADDAKNKAGQLSEKAAAEFEKASSAAQAKAGKIELYTPKYYAACVVGGLLACVSTFPNALDNYVALRVY